MGRAAELADQVITAQEYEDVLHWFYDFRKTSSMHLKATCAPHYYRIMRQRAHEDGVAVTPENFGMDARPEGASAVQAFVSLAIPGKCSRAVTWNWTAAMCVPRRFRKYGVPLNSLCSSAPRRSTKASAGTANTIRYAAAAVHAPTA